MREINQIESKKQNHTSSLLASLFQLSGFLSLCFLFLAGCQRVPRQAKALISIPSAEAKKKAKVPARVRSEETRTPSLDIPTGRIEKRVLVGSALSNRKVVISPEVGGVIQKIYVKKGDYVKKNSRLIWIDCSNYTMMVEQAQGQIAIAKVGLQLAAEQRRAILKDYKRFVVLHRGQSISTRQLEKIRNAKKITAIQLVLAQKRLVLGQIGLKMAKKRRNGCMTTAPFAGVVSNRMMDEGSLVRAMPPSMVLVIEEVDPIVLEVPVGEMYLKNLKNALSVKVVVPSLGRKTLYTLPKGILVKSLMPSLNPYNRSAMLRIQLPNKHKLVKPGMTVEIHITQQAQITQRKESGE